MLLRGESGRRYVGGLDTRRGNDEPIIARSALKGGHQLPSTRLAWDCNGEFHFVLFCGHHCLFDCDYHVREKAEVLWPSIDGRPYRARPASWP